MKPMLMDSTSFTPDSSQENSGAFLQDYLKVLRRRRAVIIQSFVIITVVAIVVTLMTKPVYQASARLLVENAAASYNAVDTSNPISGILALSQPQSVATQVEVLQSPSLQQQVTEKVGPASMSVQAIQDTNVIETTAESNDPQTAANAANALLQAYIDQDTNQSLADIRSAEDFARRKQAESHQQLTIAAAQLEAFKRQHHIAELNSERGTQIQREVALINDVKTAQTNLAAYQSQYAVLHQQLSQVPELAHSRVSNTNPRIVAIQDKLDDLNLQREGLTQKGGFAAKAPQIRGLDAQIARLKSELKKQPALINIDTVTPNQRRSDILKALGDLQVQMASVNTVLTNKRAEMAQAAASVGRYAIWDTTINRLTYNVNNAATLDKIFSDKMADLSLREQAHHATARIDEVASVPTSPVRPKKLQNILLGCLFGLFVGVLMALLQEFLDDRINSMEDSDRVLGLPSLGFVPKLSVDDARLLPQMKGLDPAAESYRLLRTNIQFAAIDHPMKTLLVTSSSPGEGKTTTASNLAFAMVMDGKRVILVDADLRRPSVHKLLELPSTPGLTDVLLGRSTLDDTLLSHAQMPDLRILTAGSTPPNPGELINSRAFRTLIDQLKEMADVVIFDSPPVLVSSDSPILGSIVDGTILVVETNETRKTPARRAVSLMQKGRANMLGVMYNKMRTNDSQAYYYQYQYTTPALEDAASDATRTKKELSGPNSDNNS